MSFLTMKNLKISPYLLLAFVLLGFRLYTKFRWLFEDADDAKSAVCEVVDLGLPSGTLWADRNIGSESEGDFGWYFAWGEVTPKYIYNFVSYQYAVDSGCGGEAMEKNATTAFTSRVRMGIPFSFLWQGVAQAINLTG